MMRKIFVMLSLLAAAVTHAAEQPHLSHLRGGTGA